MSMGVNQSSLSGHAKVPQELYQFRDAGIDQINAMLTRYRNKVDAFAVGAQDFAIVIGSTENTVRKWHCIPVLCNSNLVRS